MVGFPLRVLLMFFRYVDDYTQMHRVCKLWSKARTIYESAQNFSQINYTKAFQNLFALSTGTFSNVYGFRIFNSFYTLKRMDKVTQAHLQNIRCLRREIKTHSICYHPNIIQLYHVHQDVASLYIIEEYAQYGDLFDVVNNINNRRAPLSFVLFTCSEIVLALTYLHQRNILFRDLRLENIVVSGDLRMKLTDFGNAKFLSRRQKTYTLCGVPESCAPEMLCSKGYSHSVDWWALGVLLYEMSIGYSPFYSENEMDTYARILNRDLKLTLLQEKTLDKSISVIEEVKYVIRLLLVDDSSFRKSYAANVSSIFDRMSGWVPYFESIEWDKLQREESSFSINRGAHKRHLKNLPKAQPLQNRMAQIEWNRYCGEF